MTRKDDLEHCNKYKTPRNRKKVSIFILSKTEFIASGVVSECVCSTFTVTEYSNLLCSPQACYGIVKVPVGNWLCRTCVLGIDPQCLLCPQKGGAMKATRAGTKWAHVSCALRIPEVN